MQSNIIKKLPAISGRTFVCGDIHGSFSRVEEFLEFINFNKETDRLISVGDIVDRGPQNEKSLALLHEPWFHAVKGNHEDLMLRFYGDQHGGEWWAPNGGTWGLKYCADIPYAGSYLIDNGIKVLVEKTKELPFMISVEKNDGSFYHVIHAELAGTPDDLITSEALRDEEKFNKISSKMDFDGVSVLWKRSVFYVFMRQHIDEHFLSKLKKAQSYGKYKTIFADDCDIVYSGHTIVRRPLQYHRQINLDTCAYGSYATSYHEGKTIPKWCGLTVTEPETNKFWLVNSYGIGEVEHIKIDPLSLDKQTELDDAFCPPVYSESNFDDNF